MDTKRNTTPAACPVETAALAEIREVAADVRWVPGQAGGRIDPSWGAYPETSGGVDSFEIDLLVDAPEGPAGLAYLEEIIGEDPETAVVIDEVTIDGVTYCAEVGRLAIVIGEKLQIAAEVSVSLCAA